MFAKLPADVQLTVRKYLLENNFPATKAVHDAWLDVHTECLPETDHLPSKPKAASLDNDQQPAQQTNYSYDPNISFTQMIPIINSQPKLQQTSIFYDQVGQVKDDNTQKVVNIAQYRMHAKIKFNHY